MRSIIIALLLFTQQIICAQNFTEVSPEIPFIGVFFSAVAFSDIDEDSDLDILITGWNSTEKIIKLYTNDSNGNFTEVPEIPFEAVSKGDIAFSDVDNDGDQDVLITGLDNSNSWTSKLYSNDGNGDFTEVVDTPFENVIDSSIAFSDIDGDGDEDVIITGVGVFMNLAVTKLYINDGSGNFTEMTNTPFVDVELGSVAFSDIDNDGDEDVLITGYNSSLGSVARLYINNGLGNFSLVTNTPFIGVSVSSIAFADVDNDNDKDVFITGNNNSYYGRISKLYINEGTTLFTEASGTQFTEVAFSSVAFSDVDNDGDQDLLVTGRNDTDDKISELYLNNGNSTFTEVTPSPFDGSSSGSVAFADVDGDSDKDVLLTGITSTQGFESKLYLNDLITSLSDNLPNELDFGFNLYPTPTNTNWITIDFNSNDQNQMTINIIDSKGELIQSKQKQCLGGHQLIKLDISNLVKGNYFLQIKKGENSGSRIFVIQ